MVLVMLGLALVGCASTDDQNRAPDEQVSRFVGTLPCGDCRAIRADLTLFRNLDDGSPEQYVLQETHVDAVGGDFTSTTWGDWQLSSNGEHEFYRLENTPGPLILRVEHDGKRLGWAGGQTLPKGEGSYELVRDEPLR
ncbi:hypothetical protein AR456_18235 [Halomonas huangheensis]|nr:hypothetical protein AR456_18235 [Halomonas huangheensis]